MSEIGTTGSYFPRSIIITLRSLTIAFRMHKKGSNGNKAEYTEFQNSQINSNSKKTVNNPKESSVT